MKLELTRAEYRALLDLVYIGNWIVSETADIDSEARFEPDTPPGGIYDAVTSKVFAHCFTEKLYHYAEIRDGAVRPTETFAKSGAHNKILDYEDVAFFEILAEELARRDLGFPPIGEDNVDELNSLMDEYIAEFEENGVEHIAVVEDI